MTPKKKFKWIICNVESIIVPENKIQIGMHSKDIDILMQEIIKDHKDDCLVFKLNSNNKRAFFIDDYCVFEV